jgi:hypothetical protein
MRPNGCWVPSYSMPLGRERRTFPLRWWRRAALPRVGSPNNTLTRSGLALMRCHRGREGQL